MIRKSVVSSDDVGTPRRCRCQVARRPDCAIVKPQDAQTVPMSSHKMPRRCQCQAARCPDRANVKPQDAQIVPQDAQTVPMSSHKMPRLCHCQATRCPDCATRCPGYANVKPQDAQTVPQDAQAVPMSSQKMPRLCQCQATRCPDSLSGNTSLRRRVQFPAQQHPADRRTHFHKRSDCQDTRSFRRCRCQSFPAGSRAATLAVS